MCLAYFEQGWVLQKDCDENEETFQNSNHPFGYFRSWCLFLSQSLSLRIAETGSLCWISMLDPEKFHLG